MDIPNSLDIKIDYEQLNVIFSYSTVGLGDDGRCKMELN